MTGTNSKSKKKQKIAILTSGGLVSTTLLEHCTQNYSSVQPIYIQSGFRWEEGELFWLKKFLRGWKKDNVEALEILQLPLKDTYQTSWSVTGVKVPQGGQAKAKDIVLPGREAILLTKAASFCASQGIHLIAIGFCQSQERILKAADLIERVQSLISDSLATELRIIAPYLEKTREEALFEIRDRGYALGYSCISPKGYQHCGDCYKCHERKADFMKTGVTDKTLYYRSQAYIATPV